MLKKIILLFLVIVTSFNLKAQVSGTPFFWKKIIKTIPCPVSDKSPTIDTDGDGIMDACDLDSDNDGIFDSIENTNNNRFFNDDDHEGDSNAYPQIGDGIPNYLDLDSDNDGILDLHESGIPLCILQIIDKDMNGIIDSDIPVGKNGFADILETFPDSGIPKYPILDTNNDGVPDYLSVGSDGLQYDLYLIGKSNLDQYGGGFTNFGNDADGDGIMAAVDTKLDARGAPGSPASPHINPTPKLSATAVSNTCPDNFALFPTVTNPRGNYVQVQYHTVANNPSAATRINSDRTTTAGTYYVYFFYIECNVYSPATSFNVAINSCP